MKFVREYKSRSVDNIVSREVYDLRRIHFADNVLLSGSRSQQGAGTIVKLCHRKRLPLGRAERSQVWVCLEIKGRVPDAQDWTVAWR